MLNVAVTGNLASGKSTLSRIWAGEGVPVIMADDLARSVVEPGTPGLQAVVEAFGTGVLLEDGRLDRAYLRELVFQDSAERARLERILHPLIQARRTEWLRDRVEEGAGLTVAEIPLLFEAGLEGDFDLVVLVDASPQERLRRLTQDRGLAKGEAERMMASQMPAEEKRKRADFIVQNDGAMEDFTVRALALLDLLRARAAGKRAP